MAEDGYIKVQVTAAAKKDAVTPSGEDSFAVQVKAKAQANAANRRLIELLAEHLGMPAQRIHIVGGHHRPNKLLRIVPPSASQWSGGGRRNGE